MKSKGVKRVNLTLLSISIILILSVSLVSATLLGDMIRFFGKMAGTGNVVGDFPGECADSDGKDNFLVAGYVRANAQNSYDYCLNGVAYDYYCEQLTQTGGNALPIVSLPLLRPAITGYAAGDFDTPDDPNTPTGDIPPPVTCTDADADGYKKEGGACGTIDCLDSNKFIFPNNPNADCDCSPTTETGVAEICDNKDNNCDGYIDNGATCQAGYTCVSGSCQSNPTYGPATTTKNCAAYNMPCNGGGICGCTEDKPCSNEYTGKGICVAGIMKCNADGTYGNCNATYPITETLSPSTCNGKDDDCDGVTDQYETGICQTNYFCNNTATGWRCVPGSPSGTCIDGDVDGYGNPGSSACANGSSATDCDNTNKFIFPTNTNADCDCNPTTETGRAEVCDGKDNNCDGIIDNGATCTSGTCVNGACTVCTDTCATFGFTCGSQTICSTSVTCPPGCTSPLSCTSGQCKDLRTDAEVCLDWQCGTKTDASGVIRNCGSCASGTTCDNHYCISDICIDNDNDGYGANGGSAKCSKGSVLEDCDDNIASINPGAKETCNGVDDDCDTIKDEGLGEETCGEGECKVTISKCLNGQNQTCTKKAPVAETCNGKDDDCDGTIDNKNMSGLGGLCTTGLQGICSQGNTICSSGKSVCEPKYKKDQIKETCDNLDNDCDGIIDNGCPCTIGNTQDCGKDVGVCEFGKVSCVNGEWGKVCEGGIGPQITNADVLSANTKYEKTEISCDNLDNDCDGNIDEDLKADCGAATTTGICKKGETICTNGKWSDCTGEVSPLRAEKCDNDLDDNCNGNINDGCPCREGTTEECGSDVGSCEKGKKTCTQGVWGECAGSIVAEDEICGDNNDNDCNGLIDDGCECNADDVELCGSNIGICLVGSKQCTSGLWGLCNLVQGPEQEICGNGVDEDCDTIKDNGCEQVNFVDGDGDGIDDLTGAVINYGSADDFLEGGSSSTNQNANTQGSSQKGAMKKDLSFFESLLNIFKIIFSVVRSMVGFTVSEIPQVHCTDSDGGKNFFQKGTGSGLNTQDTETWFADFCYTETQNNQVEKCSGDTCFLKEYYCNQEKITSEPKVKCNYGCSNGACVPDSSLNKDCMYFDKELWTWVNNC